MLSIHPNLFFRSKVFHSKRSLSGVEMPCRPQYVTKGQESISLTVLAYSPSVLASFLTVLTSFLREKATSLAVKHNVFAVLAFVQREAAFALATMAVSPTVLDVSLFG
jgi:hypothetical protein